MAGDVLPLGEHFNERLEAMEKTSELLREMMNMRLDSMNQVREQLREQAATGITRKEVEVRMDRMELDIRRIGEFQARAEGKASQTSVWINLLVPLGSGAGKQRKRKWRKKETIRWCV